MKEKDVIRGGVEVPKKEIKEYSPGIKNSVEYHNLRTKDLGVKKPQVVMSGWFRKGRGGTKGQGAGVEEKTEKKK